MRWLEGTRRCSAYTNNSLSPVPNTSNKENPPICMNIFFTIYHFVVQAEIAYLSHIGPTQYDPGFICTIQ